MVIACIRPIRISLTSIGGFSWRLTYGRVRLFGQATQPSVLRLRYMTSVTDPTVVVFVVLYKGGVGHLA